MHKLILGALHKHGLLRGWKLGIYSSVIEANASLRALEHRNTEENYWEYVKRLAAEAGVDSDDTKAVRRFDKKRPGRKTNNEDWVNPHDPDAKVGRTKDGATDMTYKPDHVSDLESGAIIEAEVREGDEADTEEQTDRMMVAINTVQEVCPNVPLEKLGKELAASEGYFALEEIGMLQEAGVRTVISDPHAAKRRKDMSVEQRAILRRATRATKSKSGKALLRKRGEFLERGFCHVLDHGGMRQATLRGKANLSKRYVAAAFSFNLSLLLRAVIVIGTPKQWLASGRRRVSGLFYHLSQLLEGLGGIIQRQMTFCSLCTLLLHSCVCAEPRACSQLELNVLR